MEQGSYLITVARFARPGEVKLSVPALQQRGRRIRRPLFSCQDDIDLPALAHRDVREGLLAPVHYCDPINDFSLTLVVGSGSR